MNLMTGKLVHHLLAIILIILQAACLDYFLVVFNQEEYGLVFLGWIAADIMVLTIFVGSYYFGALYVKQQDLQTEEPASNALINGKKQAAEVDNYLPFPPMPKIGNLGEPVVDLRRMGVLPYGWLGWLVYSSVLVGKIIAAFKTFGPNLNKEDINAINWMELSLGGTAGVFILVLGGTEKLTTNAQKNYVRWMQHYVLLEIVDCVEFLTLLYASAEGGDDMELLPWTLQDIILVCACINLLAPALALYRLSSRHNRHPEKRNRFFLSQTLVGTVFGNLPYFIVRVYLWNFRNLVTGLFTMKNLIGILQDSQELIEYVRDLAKARLDGSNGSLATAARHHQPREGDEKFGLPEIPPETRRKLPYIDDE